MSHENIANTFDQWAASGKADGLQEEHGDVVAQVIPRLSIRPGMLILDLGCGTGWATRKLAAAAPGARAIGLDLSPAMIARAEASHDLTSRARYEVGRFEALDYPDGRFDRVFSMEALYYAVDLDAALREMHRVLKPNGLAHAIVDCYAEAPTTETWAAKVGLDLHRLPAAEWERRFEQAGFLEVASERVIDSRGVGDAAGFRPDPHDRDWAARVARHAAGSLWIRGRKG